MDIALDLVTMWGFWAWQAEPCSFEEYQGTWLPAAGRRTAARARGTLGLAGTEAMAGRSLLPSTWP